MGGVASQVITTCNDTLDQHESLLFFSEQVFMKSFDGEQYSPHYENDIRTPTTSTQRNASVSVSCTKRQQTHQYETIHFPPHSRLKKGKLTTNPATPTNNDSTRMNQKNNNMSVITDYNALNRVDTPVLPVQSNTSIIHARKSQQEKEERLLITRTAIPPPNKVQNEEQQHMVLQKDDDDSISYDTTGSQPQTHVDTTLSATVVTNTTTMTSSSALGPVVLSYISSDSSASEDAETHASNEDHQQQLQLQMQQSLEEKEQLHPQHLMVVQPRTPSPHSDVASTTSLVSTEEMRLNYDHDQSNTTNINYKKGNYQEEEEDDCTTVTSHSSSSYRKRNGNNHISRERVTSSSTKYTEKKSSTTPTNHSHHHHQQTSSAASIGSTSDYSIESSALANNNHNSSRNNNNNQTSNSSNTSECFILLNPATHETTSLHPNMLAAPPPPPPPNPPPTPPQISNKSNAQMILKHYRRKSPTKIVTELLIPSNSTNTSTLHCRSTSSTSVSPTTPKSSRDASNNFTFEESVVSSYPLPVVDEIDSCSSSTVVISTTPAASAAIPSNHTSDTNAGSTSIYPGYISPTSDYTTSTTVAIPPSSLHALQSYINRTEDYNNTHSTGSKNMNQFKDDDDNYVEKEDVVVQEDLVKPIRELTLKERVTLALNSSSARHSNNNNVQSHQQAQSSIANHYYSNDPSPSTKDNKHLSSISEEAMLVVQSPSSSTSLTQSIARILSHEDMNTSISAATTPTMQSPNRMHHSNNHVPPDSHEFTIRSRHSINSPKYSIPLGDTNSKKQQLSSKIQTHNDDNEGQQQYQGQLQSIYNQQQPQSITIPQHYLSLQSNTSISSLHHDNSSVTSIHQQQTTTSPSTLPPIDDILKSILPSTYNNAPSTTNSSSSSTVLPNQTFSKILQNTTEEQIRSKGFVRGSKPSSSTPDDDADPQPSEFVMRLRNSLSSSSLVPTTPSVHSKQDSKNEQQHDTNNTTTTTNSTNTQNKFTLNDIITSTAPSKNMTYSMLQHKRKQQQQEMNATTTDNKTQANAMHLHNDERLSDTLQQDIQLELHRILGTNTYFPPTTHTKCLNEDVEDVSSSRNTNDTQLHTNINSDTASITEIQSQEYQNKIPQTRKGSNIVVIHDTCDDNESDIREDDTDLSFYYNSNCNPTTPTNNTSKIHTTSIHTATKTTTLQKQSMINSPTNKTTSIHTTNTSSSSKHKFLKRIQQTKKEQHALTKPNEEPSNISSTTSPKATPLSSSDRLLSPKSYKSFLNKNRHRRYMKTNE